MSGLCSLYECVANADKVLKYRIEFGTVRYRMFAVSAKTPVFTDHKGHTFVG